MQLNMPDDLNPAQSLAVNTLTGPLLVLAGAGSGKTRVVTYRIANLIRHGVSPSRILAVTFTNKAAAEMQQRAAALLGKRLPAKPEISTFHSLCLRILRRNATTLGYPTAFAIYDRGDQESVARSVLREIKMPESAMQSSDLLYRISRWKSAAIRPAEAAATAETDKDHLAAAAYRRYQNAMHAAGAVDFDDLLLCTEQLFEEFPEVREAEAHRFDHLLVDEYQDTNGSQYRIVKALAQNHRNLCVVGDDDQSIYAWRGAEVTHILRFKRDWPDAKVISLEDNYRSTHAIIGWANQLITCNKERHPKVLRAHKDGPRPRILQQPDEEDEAHTVVAEIVLSLCRQERQAKDFAILFRTNDQTSAFEFELRRCGVPYTIVGGQSFYDRKEVRDILAYLKVIANPRDEVSLLRILNTPPRGIGQTTIRRLLDHALETKRPLWNVLQTPEDLANVGKTAPRAIGAFVLMIQKYSRLATKQPPSELLGSLLNEVRYREDIAQNYTNTDEQNSRVANVEQVVSAAANYAKRAKSPRLAEFVQELAISDRDTGGDEKEKQLAKDAVVLMTLHAAKGLEFPVVYMVGMEEGILPHHRSIAEPGAPVDEERRLCYVGVTRAKEQLTCSMSLSRMKWGKERPTIPSRFLYELTGQTNNPNYFKAIDGIVLGEEGKKKRGREHDSQENNSRLGTNRPCGRGTSYRSR